MVTIVALGCQPAFYGGTGCSGGSAVAAQIRNQRFGLDSQGLRELLQRGQARIRNLA